MKTISSYKINYVIPETEEEELELQKIISDVKNEKFGIDFTKSDLKIIKKDKKDSKGFYIKDIDTN